MEISCPARVVRGFGESQLEVYFAKHVTQATVAGNRPGLGFPREPEPGGQNDLRSTAGGHAEQVVNLGVVALIALGLLSVVVGVSHPEAITAEYQRTSMVVP
jgi:hypothetical protein